MCALTPNNYFFSQIMSSNFVKVFSLLMLEEYMCKPTKILKFNVMHRFGGEACGSGALCPISIINFRKTSTSLKF